MEIIVRQKILKWEPTVSFDELISEMIEDKLSKFKLMKIKKTDKIFVSGHTGLVGSAIIRELKKNGYKKIITATRKKLNLVDQKKVFNFLKKKTKICFYCCSKSWGHSL